jgi:Secretion system C-terminal sorting domain
MTRFLSSSLTGFFRFLILILFFLMPVLGFGQAPANDDCAGAEVMTVNPLPACNSNEVFGDLTNATASNPSVACAGSATAKDSWFSFVAEATDHQINGFPNDVDMDLGIQVLSGACGSLTSVVCQDAGGVGNVESFVVTGLTIGNTYFIRAYEAAPHATGVLFYICVGHPLANDDCADAVNVPVNPDEFCDVDYNGTTFTATGSGNSGNCDYPDGDDDDVWMKFTATNRAHHIQFNAGNAFVIELRTDACPGTLIECRASSSNDAGLGPNDDRNGSRGGGGGQVATIIRGDFVDGETYYLRFYTQNVDDYTNFSACITTFPVIINDNCTEAIVLNADQTVCNSSGSGNFLTTAASNFAGGGCAGAPYFDAWYKFVATGPTHKIQTNAYNGDVVYEVFSGTCGSLTSISCTTVAAETYFEVNLTGLTTGETYFVRTMDAAGIGGDVAYYFCVVEPEPVPANDECTNAIEITTVDGITCSNPTTGLTVGASGSGGCNGGVADDDVWYKFTATATRHTISELTGYVPMFEIFEGGCGGTSIGCGQNYLALDNLVIGDEYHFRVFSYESGPGSALSNFSFCISAPASNDLCENAITLPLNSGATCTTTLTGTTVGATNETPFYGSDDDDVWYKMTATNTSVNLNFTPAVSGAYTIRMGIVHSSCTYFTEECSTVGQTGLKISGLTVGTEYKIQIYKNDFNGPPNSQSAFEICATNPMPPANDECVNAVNIPISNDCPLDNINGTMADATSTAPGNLNCGQARDVWFEFAATEPTHLMTMIPTSAVGMTIYNSTGCPSSPTSNVFLTFNFTPTATTKFISGLTIGQTYYVKYATVMTEPTFTVSLRGAIDIETVASGDWNNPATWTCSTVPAIIDNVKINTGHTVSNNPNTGCKDLTVDGTLSLSGTLTSSAAIVINGTVNDGAKLSSNQVITLNGNCFMGFGIKTFTANQGFTGSGTLTFESTNGGNFTFNAGSVLNVHTIHIMTGQIYVNTDITITNLNFTGINYGGRFACSSNVSVNKIDLIVGEIFCNGTIQTNILNWIRTPAGIGIIDGYSGLITVSGQSTIVDAGFYNATSTVLDFNGPVSWTQPSYGLSYLHNTHIAPGVDFTINVIAGNAVFYGTINNAGNFIKQGAGGLFFQPYFGNGVINNNGNFTVNDGQVIIESSGNHNGTFTYTNSTPAIHFKKGTHVFNPGAAFAAGNTLSIIGDNSNLPIMNFTTDITIPKIEQSGGKITSVNSANISVTSDYLLNLGSIENNGNVQIDGNFTWKGGVIGKATGALHNINVNGFLSMPASYTPVSSFRTLVNRTLNVNGGGKWSFSGPYGSASLIYINNSAVIKIPVNKTFEIDNPTTSDSRFYTLPGTPIGKVENYGTLQVTASTSTNFDVDFENHGVVNLVRTNDNIGFAQCLQHGTFNLPNATNEAKFSGAQTFLSPTFSGIGKYSFFTAPILNIPENLTFPNLKFSGSTQIVTGTCNLTVNNHLIIESSKIETVGDITSNTLLSSFATIGNIAGTSTGTVTANGFATIYSTNLYTKTMNLNGGASWQIGNFLLDNNAILNIAAGKVFIAENFSSLANLGGSTATINNFGTFEKKLFGNVTVLNGTTFNNKPASTTKITSGTLDFDCTLNNEGIFKGMGNCDFTGATVTNNGTFQPGASPGTMNILGNYVNNIYDFEILGGTTVTKDLIQANGTITLGGTLNILHLGGNIPVGTYSIVTCTSGANCRTGTFATINMPPQFVGLATVTYSGSGAFLTFTTALPVELVEFRGYEKPTTNHFNWQTATELNTKTHTLERSENGLDNWEKIATRTGADTKNSPSFYEADDQNPLVEAYYRVKFEDFDGKTDVSPIISIKRKTASDGQFSIYPNPIRADGFVLKIPESSRNQDLKLEFFDTAGRLVFLKNLTEATAETSIFLEKEIPSGAYFLKISGEKEVQVLSVLR